MVVLLIQVVSMEILRTTSEVLKLHVVLLIHPSLMLMLTISLILMEVPHPKYKASWAPSHKKPPTITLSPEVSFNYVLKVSISSLIIWTSALLYLLPHPKLLFFKEILTRLTPHLAQLVLHTISSKHSSFVLYYHH